MHSNKCTPLPGVLDELPEILKKIESHWPVLPSGIWNSSSTAALSRHLHELSRLCMGHGQAKPHELAMLIDEQINDIIDANTPPDSTEVNILNRDLQRLKTSVDALYDRAAASEEMTQVVDLLYLHRKDVHEQIAAAVAMQSWHYHCVRDLRELSVVLSRQGAKAVLIDTSFLPELSKNPDILNSSRHHHPELFLVSNQYDIETRLKAMRAGARYLFSEPIEVDQLVSIVGECIAPKVKPRYRVLIVDDDQTQGTLLTKLLKKGGLDTLFMADPLRVLDVVSHFQPDLILMDLYMPGADGIELTRLIREREAFIAIPIVFMSGEGEQEKKLLALQAGADDFMVKPVRAQQLTATVKTRIERAKSISATGMNLSRDRLTDLPTRRALLSRLDLVCADMVSGQIHHALYTIYLSDPENDLDDWDDKEDAGRLITQVSNVLNPLLHKEDYLARSSHLGLSVLIRRNTEQAVAQLGDLIYETIYRRLDEYAREEKRFSIGLTLLDGSMNSAYAQLCHAESSAASAYKRGLKGYDLYTDNPEINVKKRADVKNRQRDQFLNALKSGSVTFQELRLNSLQGSGKTQESYELIPLYTTPSSPVNPYQLAAESGAAPEFDRLVCKRAIERLGEYAFLGKKVRLICQQSASVIEQEDYLEYIKSELYKVQIVGTGLMMDFDLRSLTINLKKARVLLAGLRALGVGISLSNFACNQTTYKVLAYLRADAVRPPPSLLRADAQRILHVSQQIHSMRAEIILPRVEHLGQLAQQWSESADYIQADFSR